MTKPTSKRAGKSGAKKSSSKKTKATTRSGVVLETTDESTPDLEREEVARFTTSLRLKDPKTIATVAVAPELIASLTLLPSPVSVSVDGLQYALVLNPDGTAKCGCQNITAKGCEQVFRALAAHLGYELEE